MTALNERIWPWHRRKSSKTQLLEHFWIEYIQHLKNEQYNREMRKEKLKPSPSEKGFWRWYIERKVKVTL